MSYSSLRPRPHLLIVDDELSNRELLTRIFQRTCDVTTATNGRQALELLVEQAFDVVLLDIMMPQLNGLDVLKIIRNSADMSELPVVLISAMDDKSDVTRGLRLGANDYITKPIDIDTVQARINTQVMLCQLIDERTRLIARLQSANEMKARMMQVASHYLKNPLNNLRILFNVIRRRSGSDENIHKLSAMADDSIDAMLQVVEDFLDNGIESSDAVTLDIRPVDSSQVLRRVLNQYAVAAHHKRIRLEASDKGGMVLADSNRLAQVIGNLVSNAIKYSPPHTTVTVQTQQETPVWRLQVLDEGPGIPADEREYLFQPFSKHKISTEPTAEESSTGLGLWIVHEMLRLQEGRVGLDEAPGGGACFWIELPLAEKSVRA